MQFNVFGLVQEGIGSARTVEVDGIIDIEGRAAEHVAGTADLLRTAAGVLVRAHLSLVEPETCSRCLAPLEETVSLSFEEEFQAVLGPEDEDLTAALDPEAFTLDPQYVLDLTEAVRQYREVSLVMKPLCRPDCRGLCPRCGKGLNLGDCGCESGAENDRWAGLAALRGVLAERKD